MVKNQAKEKIFYFLSLKQKRLASFGVIPLPQVATMPHNLSRTIGHSAEYIIPMIFKTEKFRSRVSEPKCL